MAARLKERGKAEVAAVERPRSTHRRAGAAAEDCQEDEQYMEE